MGTRHLFEGMSFTKSNSFLVYKKEFRFATSKKTKNQRKERKTIGRYLVLWEVDRTKIPIDPKERAAGWGALMAMVREDREKGLTTSWGGFIGESNGYSVFEGAELEVMNALQRYVPFVIFKVHPVSSEAQVNEMIKALSG